jgi:Protein of unknown function (DUF 659)
MNGIEESDHPVWWEGKKKLTPCCKIDKTMSSVASSTNQLSIWSFTLPAMSTFSKEQFQTHMAMHYYATGMSFQHTEDCHLAAAIKVLHPNENLLPNHKKLGSSLLKKCYNSIPNKVNDCMKNAHMCLTTDGWSDIKNYPIVNYMTASPEVCFFLESVSTGQQSHNANWIAQDIA